MFTKLESTDSRELNDRLYGGSFTELGSYCLLPVVKLLGNGFEDIRFESIKAKTDWMCLQRHPSGITED